MSNYNELQNELRDTQKKMQSLIERDKRACDHHKNGNGSLVYLADYNGPNVPKNNGTLTDSTCICTRCGRYYEVKSFTAQEIQTAMFMFISMVEQIKYQAALKEEDKRFIEEVYNSIDNMTKVSDYYLNMIKRLTDGKSNNNKKNRGSSGKITYGMPSNLYGNKY